MKNALITAPILAFPDFDKSFILSTDASEYSIGYVLSQLQNGREHAIAYGGRSLRGTEFKWHITDKEALALVEGIQHFGHYLANQEFTVFTDNVSVKYPQKIKDCQGRLERYFRGTTLKSSIVREARIQLITYQDSHTAIRLHPLLQI